MNKNAQEAFCFEIVNLISFNVSFSWKDIFYKYSYQKVYQENFPGIKIKWKVNFKNNLKQLKESHDWK